MTPEQQATVDKLETAVHGSAIFKAARYWLAVQPEGPLPVVGEKATCLELDEGDVHIMALAGIGIIAIHKKESVLVSLCGEAGSARERAAKAYVLAIMSSAYGGDDIFAGALLVDKTVSDAS